MGYITALLDKWFGKWKPRVMVGFGQQGSQRAAEAYEHDLVRAIVDTIATHAAKSEAMHIRIKDGKREVVQGSRFATLINEQPNDMITGFDLKYRMVSQLETSTTAMAYIQWAGRQPKAIYPVGWNSFEVSQISDGSYAVCFIGADGQEYKLPLEQVVMLRKFYNINDVYGGGNRAVENILSSMDAADDGMKKAMDVSNKVRLLYKTRQAALSARDKAAGAADFAKMIEKAAENGGVAMTDITEEVQPFTMTAYTLNAAQMNYITDRVLSYWRISKEVLMSNYSDNQYQAFYESVIEPILLQMGQAFTAACFTQAERDKGNRIIFVAPMLLHASTATKTNLINATKELGMFQINEARELLGYGPIEGGEKRLVSLNYVNADKQDAYQVGEDDENGTDKQTGSEGSEV